MRQSVEDRALGAFITMTLSDQQLQTLLHLLQFGDLASQLGQMLLGQALDVLTAPLPIAPQVEQLGNLHQTKPQAAGLADKTKLMQSGCVIVAITGL